MYTSYSYIADYVEYKNNDPKPIIFGKKYTSSESSYNGFPKQEQLTMKRELQTLYTVPKTYYSYIPTAITCSNCNKSFIHTVSRISSPSNSSRACPPPKQCLYPQSKSRADTYHKL